MSECNLRRCEVAKRTMKIHRTRDREGAACRSDIQNQLSVSGSSSIPHSHSADKADRSADVAAHAEIEKPPAEESALADRSVGFLLHVTSGIRIISDELQWIVEVRKGKASSKSSGWRSRHFCRSRDGLQFALRRMLGQDGVSADVVRLISALSIWHP
jgi:hypothetical protein